MPLATHGTGTYTVYYGSSLVPGGGLGVGLSARGIWVSILKVTKGTDCHMVLGKDGVAWGM